jgi:hypothetical protein
LVGYDGTIPPSPYLSVQGHVIVDHTQKTISMGAIEVPFSSYCYGGLEGPGPVPYNENDGVLTASGGNSEFSTITSSEGLPDGQQSENNQWSVTIVETNSCLSSTATPANTNAIPSTLIASPPSRSLSVNSEPSVIAVCKPIADPGPPQTVDSLAPVTLDGSRSSGLQPLTYSWTASSKEP